MWPRLKHRRQFALVYSRGRKLSSSALVLFHLENAPDRQVAFVASRRVGGAVQRNRAKRLMREAFRSVEPAVPFLHGWFVLVAHSGTPKLRSHEVAEQLGSMVARLNAGAAGGAGRS